MVKRKKERRMDRKKTLKEIEAKVSQCQACPLGRFPKAVPGEGPIDSRVMFIGEAPGYHESVQGRPFVGPAGKLLDQLLDSINLRREEVFIGNILKHRPPENRDPLPQEVEACRPFLDEQIKAIKPEVIVTLGRFSLNKFLPEEYISQAHGRARKIDYLEAERILFPLYHPAAGLRNGQILEALKADFLALGRFLKTIPGESLGQEDEAGDSIELDKPEGEQLSLVS